MVVVSFDAVPSFGILCRLWRMARRVRLATRRQCDHSSGGFAVKYLTYFDPKAAISS